MMRFKSDISGCLIRLCCEKLENHHKKAVSQLWIHPWVWLIWCNIASGFLFILIYRTLYQPLLVPTRFLSHTRLYGNARDIVWPRLSFTPYVNIKRVRQKDQMINPRPRSWPSVWSTSLENQHTFLTSAAVKCAFERRRERKGDRSYKSSVWYLCAYHVPWGKVRGNICWGVMTQGYTTGYQTPSSRHASSTHTLWHKRIITGQEQKKRNKTTMKEWQGECLRQWKSLWEREGDTGGRGYLTWY